MDLDRRRVLTGTATAGVASLAGCAGYDSSSGVGAGVGSTGTAGVGEGDANLSTITQSDADMTTTSAKAIENAGSTDQNIIVWVPSNAKINFSKITTPLDNITIASDGDPGALLYSNSMGVESSAYRGGEGTGVFRLKSNVRFTGIRLRGPTFSSWDNPKWPGYIPLLPDPQRAEKHARCISIDGHPVVIDQCELFGWPTQAICVGTNDVPVSPTIANCNLHDNQMTSYGYGIEVFHGHPLITGCKFDAHRHAIAGFGYHDCSYTVTESWFGPHPSLHVLDMHALSQNLDHTSMNPNSEIYAHRAGGKIVIRNNRFVGTHVIDGDGVNFAAGDPIPAVGINGVPANGVVLVGNSFRHVAGPQNKVTRSVPEPAALRQSNISDRSPGQAGFVKWTLKKNQFDVPYQNQNETPSRNATNNAQVQPRPATAPLPKA